MNKIIYNFIISFLFDQVPKKMAVEDLFSGCKKIIVLVAMSVLLAGFIGDFIITITWWSRIQPWFGHGEGTGKTVYQCILACWILSLIGAILTAFFLISTLCLKSVCGGITGNKIALIICIVLVGGISVGSIISGGYGSSFAIKNPKLSTDEEDYKCSKYIAEGFAGASAWALKEGKFKDYTKWLNNLKEDISKKDGGYNGYLCRDVGASTLTFVIVQCAAIILWIVILLFALIC